MFTFSVVVVDLPTDCILSFLFPAETDVLVSVISQSTDVILVNFVVVLTFSIMHLLMLTPPGGGGGGAVNWRGFQEKSIFRVGGLIKYTCSKDGAFGCLVREIGT